MTVQTKPLDDLFAKFVSTDKTHEPLTEMHYEDGSVYVSNGAIGFEIPADLLERKYNTYAEYPGLKKLIDRSGGGRFYPLESIHEAFHLWEEEPVYRRIDCDDCDGSGNDWCPCCERDSTCETCRGKGYTTTDEVVDVHLTSLPWESIKIEGYHFNPQFIYDLYRIAGALGEAGIKVTRPATLGIYRSDAKPMCFEIGSVRGVLMPVVFDRDANFTEVK